MQTMFLAVAASSLVSVLIQVIVVALICYLLWWLIGYIGLPAPFDKVARVIVACFAVIFLINALLAVAGHPFIVF